MLPSIKHQNILAVDLGINGGFCYNLEDEVTIGPMPSDYLKRASLFRGQGQPIIVAEDVRIFPGQGIVGGATFMIGKGFLIGAAAAVGKLVEFIQPESWTSCYTIKQSKHFLTKSGKKDKTAWKKHLLGIANCLACQLEPSLVNEINLKTCDAFLMWNYIARRESGNPMKKRSQLI